MLYKALLEALKEATDIVNKDRRAAAALWIADSKSKLPLDFADRVVSGPQVHWTMVPENTMKFARFMQSVGTLHTRRNPGATTSFPKSTRSTAASAVDGDVNALIAAGRHGDAEAVLQKELAARPDNPSALDALGVCLYFQNRLDESVSAYRRALALDGNRATTWYNLGTSLSDDGNAEEAIAAYRHCLALDPGNESAKYNLSRSLLLRRSMAGGLAALRSPRAQEQPALHGT